MTRLSLLTSKHQEHHDLEASSAECNYPVLWDCAVTLRCEACSTYRGVQCRRRETGSLTTLNFCCWIFFLFQRSTRYSCLWSMALVDSEDWVQHTTCSTNNLRSGWIQAKRLGCGVWTPGYVGTLTMEDDDAR